MEPEGKFLNNDNDCQEHTIEINIGSKSLILILIIIFLSFTLCKNQNTTKNKTREIIDDDSYTLDTIPSEQLNNARNSFKKYIYQDSIDPTKTLSYNLFIPSFSKIQKYPLVVFIGDARMVGKNITAPLMFSIGGPIWATDTVQEKNKCFVLVPAYNEIIMDDRNDYLINEYLDITIRLISYIKSKYNNIDSKRIYGVGQSMGATTILYLLANSPRLFAAGLIVSGQWKTEQLLGIVNATFTYVASVGDEKAFKGQNEIKNYLNSNNIKYGSITNINAQENIQILDAYFRNMLSLGYKHNFISYAKGSVLSSKSKIKNEHISTFKYGYRSEAIRDWLFQQKRNKDSEENYYSKDGRQVKTNFCELSKEDNTCTKCIDGYFLSKDGLSCTNDINCEKGNPKKGYCNWCKQDYYLDIKDLKCKSNLEKGEYKFCKIVNKGICTDCDNYHFLDEGNKCTDSKKCIKSKDGICLKCQKGYHLTLDKRCSKVKKCIYANSYECTECEDGYYYDRFNQTCKYGKGNFTNCKANQKLNKKRCAICKDGYYLSLFHNNCRKNTEKNEFYHCQVSYNGHKCQVCIKGYFLGREDSKCSKIEGCIRSENEDKCLECDNDFCLNKEGKCVNNYYIIENDKKFFYRCKSSNDKGNGCLSCENGLVPNKDGLCYDDIHCDKKENGICQKCLKEHSGGYYSYCLNKEFGCIDSFLKNCIRCDDIFNLDSCTQCENGYQIDENGYCVQKK